MAKKRTKKIIEPPKAPFSIREYEASPYWRHKSQSILENTECRCALCGRARWKWQVRNKAWKRVLRFCVHHISYANVPDERPEDFLVLCYTCHELCHSIFQKRKISPMYEELAQVIERYGFSYEKDSKEVFYGKQQA